MASSDDIVQKIVVEGGDQAVAAFEALEQGAVAALGNITKAATSMLGSLGPVGEVIGAAIGAFAGLALALERITESASNSAASLRGLALLSGTSVENMSALTMAFAGAGVGVEGLATSFRRLAMRVSEDLPKVRKEIEATSDTIASARLKEEEAINRLNKLQGVSVSFDEHEIEIKKAEIAVSEARRARIEAENNSLQRYQEYFDSLAKGVQVSTAGMNMSLENLRKGLVASLGEGATQIKNFDGSLRRAADPSVQQILLKTGDIFKNMPDGIQKTALAVELFGRSAGPGLIAFLNQGSVAIQAEMDRIKGLGLVLTDVESGALKKFRVANFELADTLDQLKEKFAAAISPAFTAALKQANHFLEEHTADIVKLGEMTLKILTRLGEAWTAILPVIKLFGLAIGYASDAGAGLIAWGVWFTDWLTDKLVAGLKTAVDWVNNLIDAFLRLIGVRGQATSAPAAQGASDAGGLPMASGGLVWGKGGIDTNLAWLTSGEYVIRAAAVRAIGLRALDAINAGAPRFASGGLNMGPRLATVSATAAGSSQRTLHLTIEGRSFSGLSIPESTAQSLERFAVHSQIASAGRRPSWRR